MAPTAESVRETGVAHFSIDGEWLTGLARDIAVEGRWDRALRMLVDSLADGFTWDHAVSVLSGEKKLVGVNDLELVDEDPKVRAEYRERLDWPYAGRFPQGDHWFRPYAVVSWGFNREDALHANTNVGRRRLGWGSDWSNASDWGRARALYYANNPGTDLAVVCKVKPNREEQQVYKNPDTRMEHYVLFEHVDPAPPWYGDSHPHDPQAAVDEFERVCGKLEDRGAHPTLLRAAQAHEAVVEEIDDTFDANNQRGIRGADPGSLLSMSQIGDLSAERIEHAHKAAEARRLAREHADAEYEAQVAAQETEDRARWQGLHERIVAQASEPDGGGFIDLELAGTTYHVPRAPFENWSLWRTAGKHLAHPWECVSQPGMRLMIDDQYHTDWLLGAGVECFLRDTSGNLDARQAWRDACYKAQYAVQKSALRFECNVLAGTGRVRGEVIHPEPGQEVPAGSIIVIPVAGPDYDIPARTAGPTGCVITAAGGNGAHLAVVGRELGLRVVRVEDAVRLYPPGVEVVVNLDDGSVRVSDTPVRDMFGGM